MVNFLSALETGEKVKWDHLRLSLDTVSSLSFEGSLGERGSRCDELDLRILAMLADLVTICGQSNRCVPHARDIVGRFSRKSIEQGAFFRDVRMTPAHCNELVALAAPHLPASLKGPAAIPAQWRFFAVLFWMAQGGRQRVVARAVDFSQSFF